MKNKPKLTFRFHNPNSEEVMSAHVAKIFVEASKIKFEKVLQESLADMPQNEKETA